MTDLLLKEKPCDILMVLRRNMMSDSLCKVEVRKKSDTTYAHAAKLCDKLEDRGLVEIVKKGRRANISLTDKGRTVSKKLVEIEEEREY